MTFRTRARLDEGGYLLEIPALVILLCVVSIILLKFFPSTWMAAGVAALVSAGYLGFLYYNFLLPGWLPGGFRQQFTYALSLLFIISAFVFAPMLRVSERIAYIMGLAVAGGFVMMLALRLGISLWARIRRKNEGNSG